MTGIGTTCPQCASAIEFRRMGRHGRIAAVCSTCASAFTMTPAGIQRLVRAEKSPTDPLP